MYIGFKDKIENLCITRIFNEYIRKYNHKIYQRFCKMLCSFAEYVGPVFSEHVKSLCALFNFQSNELQGQEL